MFNLPRAQLPIEQLIEIRDLLPRLQRHGVEKLGEAEQVLDIMTSSVRRMFDIPELLRLEAAIQCYDAERAFLEGFEQWALLEHSNEARERFAAALLQHFSASFVETRLVYLGLPRRIGRALEQDGFETVGDVLRRCAELPEVRNLGERSLGELFRLLGQFARVYRYVVSNLWDAEAQHLQARGLVAQLLGQLRPREQEVIQHRYGIEREAETLRQIGTRLGISRERARQLQTRAIGKLQHGSALALVEHWVEQRLPAKTRRIVASHGAVIPHPQLIAQLHAQGCPLDMLADILEEEATALLKRAGLARVEHNDLWAISKPVAALCREVHAVYASLVITHPPESQPALRALSAHFKLHPDPERPFEPDEAFLRAVMTPRGR